MNNVVTYSITKPFLKFLSELTLFVLTIDKSYVTIYVLMEKIFKK